MRLYPEMTASLWLHDLEPVYSGDTIDLDTTDVTFALADLDGTIIQEPLAATKIGTSFRLIITVPADPGRYKVLARAEAGTSVYRSVTTIYVRPVTDETP